MTPSLLLLLEVLGDGFELWMIERGGFVEAIGGRPGRFVDVVTQSVCDRTHLTQESDGCHSTRRQRNFCVRQRSHADLFAWRRSGI